MKKVVVLGGGTGNFTVLQALKHFSLELTAIVSMADDGGSTGRLRDELGVLPPGDVRQCLVALSQSSRLMRELMNYRFEEGSLKGHSFGNLFLCALEKTTGSFETAIEEVGKILNIKGRVIPVTTNDVRLKMHLTNGTILEGEGEIYESTNISQGYTKLYLDPTPSADPHAIKAIMEADAIILGPGGIFSSLLPLLLVPGIPQAIKESKAHKIFILNLMNKKGQTDNFTAKTYIQKVEELLTINCFDSILINNAKPAKHIQEKYQNEATAVQNDCTNIPAVIATDLISDELKQVSKADPMAHTRNLIRHDPQKLAAALMTIIEKL